jgi:hypothetical protein
VIRLENVLLGYGWKIVIKVTGILQFWVIIYGFCHKAVNILGYLKGYATIFILLIVLKFLMKQLYLRTTIFLTILLHFRQTLKFQLKY